MFENPKWFCRQPWPIYEFQEGSLFGWDQNNERQFCQAQSLGLLQMCELLILSKKGIWCLLVRGFIIFMDLEELVSFTSLRILRSWPPLEQWSWGLLASKIKSRFSGRGRGQQFFTFQSPAVHWIAQTSSLNCLSCRILTKPLIHWIASPLFTENPFFSLKSASSHPLPKNRLWKIPCGTATVQSNTNLQKRLKKQI